MKARQPQKKDTNISPRIKLVLIGDAGVGKTQLVKKLYNGEFEEKYEATIGASFIAKTLILDSDLNINTTAKLEIWDTAGQERFRALLPMYYQASKICMVVCDLTNRQSFLNISTYLNMLKDENDVEIVLVGNKSDLKDKREVSAEEFKEFASNKGFSYIELSAKKENIEESFRNIIGRYLKHLKDDEEKLELSITKSSGNAFLHFMKKHWWKMLIGAALVGGVVALGVITGGAVPVIAVGVALALGVSVAVGAGLGLSGILSASMLFGAFMTGLIAALFDRKEKPNQLDKKINGSPRLIGSVVGTNYQVAEESEFEEVDNNKNLKNSDPVPDAPNPQKTQGSNQIYQRRMN